MRKWLFYSKSEAEKNEQGCGKVGKVSDAEIITVLLTNGGNKSECARKLGIDRKTIQNRFHDDRFVEAFEDAKKARDELLCDLRNTATIRALEFIVESLEKPTASIYDTDGLTWKNKLQIAEMALKYGK